MNLSIAAQVDIPAAVYVIWGIVLAIAILVILPLTIYLLQRTLNAARNIERYMGEMRDAGVGIAGNTQHISTLDDTIGVATNILETAGRIESHTATIKETLTARVTPNGREENAR